jgi:uncharacterized protein (TIGR03435 family)
MNGLSNISVALLMAVAVADVRAQSAGPAFEVESVKPMPQDGRTWALRQVNPARYRSLSNVRQLLTWAWKVRDYQIIGAPAWTSQERFEIQATTGKASSVDEQRLMVRKLLADHFNLKAHRESREIPVYLLVVGPSGPKLTPAKDGGDPKHRGINIYPGLLEAQQGGLEDFAEILTTNLDRPVLNRTNLTGSYDFKLTWDQADEPSNGPVWTPLGAVLFPLIRSIGLRLDSARAPVEMLVIDSVERPTEK